MIHDIISKIKSFQKANNERKETTIYYHVERKHRTQRIPILRWLCSPPHSFWDLRSGGGGTTRGATPSLTLYTDDDDFDGHTRFQGYVSGQDYCFTCGDGPDDDGTLGYCWNNKECPPACGNARGVSGRMDGECGTACQTFKFSSSWLKSSYTDKD